MGVKLLEKKALKAFQKELEYGVSVYDVNAIENTIGDAFITSVCEENRFTTQRTGTLLSKVKDLTNKYLEKIELSTLNSYDETLVMMDEARRRVNTLKSILKSFNLDYRLKNIMCDINYIYRYPHSSDSSIYKKELISNLLRDTPAHTQLNQYSEYLRSILTHITKDDKRSMDYFYHNIQSRSAYSEEDNTPLLSIIVRGNLSDIYNGEYAEGVAMVSIEDMIHFNDRGAVACIDSIDHLVGLIEYDISVLRTQGNISQETISRYNNMSNLLKDKVSISVLETLINLNSTMLSCLDQQSGDYC